jgi:predicted nucleic acid-binding protein
MHIVIDSNIIFSAIISGDQRYIELVKKIHFYLPDFALKELEKYEDVILKKRKLPVSDFRAFVKTLFEEISVIPKFAISTIKLSSFVMMLTPKILLL